MAVTISQRYDSINEIPQRSLLLFRAMAALTIEELTRKVFEVLRDEILNADDHFSTRSNLIDSGLDSLAVTQLMLSIEECTGVWVDESLLTPENLESAESLASLVYEQLQAG
jgi:acyl carrier protein